MESVHQNWLFPEAKESINKICQKASSESCYLVDKHSKKPVPLKKIELKADVVQALASFQMVQHYVNIEDTPLETVFLFPTDIASIITKLTCTFTLADGTQSTLETQVTAREKAEVIYENAVASGKTAVISTINKAHRDMVRISVGNFPPQSTAVLTLFYYQHLSFEDVSYCLRIPTTYIPKYVARINNMLAAS